MMGLAWKPPEIRPVLLKPTEIGKTPIQLGGVEFVEVQPTFRVLLTIRIEKFTARISGFQNAFGVLA